MMTLKKIFAAIALSFFAAVGLSGCALEAVKDVTQTLPHQLPPPGNLPRQLTPPPPGSGNYWELILLCRQIPKPPACGG
jgi:hypothetical protein